MNITAFPKKEIPVKVCDFLYGYKAAFAQSTDSSRTERWAMEMYAYLYNCHLTDFVNPYVSPTDNMAETQATGRVNYECYFPTDRWRNPKTGAYELIPDYASSVWTSAGASVFSVVVGASKTVDYPNHGQQIYDLSAGAYGWDYVNGIPGINQGKELFDLISTLFSYFQSNAGRACSSFSYRNDQYGGEKMLMTKYLGGRASRQLNYNLTDHSQTDFGLSKQGAYIGFPQQPTTRPRRINQPSSSKYKDMYGSLLNLGTQAQVEAYIKSEIEFTITNGGFFNDFGHRYTWTLAQYPHFGRLLSTVDTAVGSDKLWRACYGDIVEYLFFKEMIADVSAYSDGVKIKLVFQKSDPYKAVNSGLNENIPYGLIRVPISIDVDLTGTILAGKNITVNYGTIKENGSNKYTIQIPFGNAFEGFGAIEITESVTGNYIDLNKPSVLTTVKSGNSITVTTNMPTRLALFRNSTGLDMSNCVINSRSNELKTSHQFDITGYTSGYDFIAGVISEFKQSILSDYIV
jgi:hypothetical protein